VPAPAWVPGVYPLNRATFVGFVAYADKPTSVHAHRPAEPRRARPPLTPSEASHSAPLLLEVEPSQRPALGELTTGLLRVLAAPPARAAA
jgi:hypothetical protein